MSSEDPSGIVIMSPSGYGVELTKEQAACVNFNGEKSSLIVKGVAGSGKSLVLMTKATQYRNKFFEPGAKNGIAFFSHTNSLTNYAKEFLDPNEQIKEFIKISTLDAHVSEIAATMMDKPDYPKGSRVSPEKRKEILEEVLKKRALDSNHRFYKFDDKNNTLAKNVSFWETEFEWMLGLGISTNERDRYLEIPRKGRSHTRNMRIEDRYEAFDIFKDYIQTLKKKHLTEWLMIHAFVSRHRSEIPEEFKFNYIFVDEAQDLPIVDMLTAISIAKKEIMIAMDSNQRLYTHHWMLKDLGIPVTSKYLKKTFRCTKQIDMFAEALRSVNEKYLDKDELYVHTTPQDEGIKPLVIGFPNENSEKRMVTKIAELSLKVEKARTAIILRTRGEIDSWSEWLSSVGIEHEIIIGKSKNWWTEKDQQGRAPITYHTRNPGIKLCTIHSAKGLEFHNVIIPHFKTGRYPGKFNNKGNEFTSEEDWYAHYRNLSYVAMTRAQWNLIITYYDEPSIFLDEIFEVNENKKESEDDEDLFDYIEYEDFADEDEMFETIEEMLEIDPDKPLEKNVVYGKQTSAPAVIYTSDNNIDEQKRYYDEKEREEFHSNMSKAKNGDGHSMYLVGRAYESGKGVEQNRTTAIEWYKKGADVGNPECLYSYGLALKEGIYIEKQTEEGIKWIARSAHNGYVTAQETYAQMLFEGKEIKQNKTEAFEWLQRAGNNGSLDSQLKLIQFYTNGTDYVKKDLYQANHWIKIAADNGSIEMMHEYASIMAMEGAFGFNSYYSDNIINCKKSAIEYYSRAASAGYPPSQYEMYKIYRDGRMMTEPNQGLAEYWLTKAANSGWPKAQYELYNLLKSRSDEESQKLAFKYLNKAAKNDNEEAKKELGKLADEEESEKANKIYGSELKFDNDSPVLDDPEYYCELFKRYTEKTTKYHNIYYGAYYNYALCLFNGIGVEKNLGKAFQYIEKASEEIPEAMFDFYLILDGNIIDSLYIYLFYGHGAIKQERCIELLVDATTRQYGKAALELSKHKYTIPDIDVETLLLTIAAKSNVNESYLKLAQNLENGYGLDKPDPNYAKYWYSRAKSIEPNNNQVVEGLERLKNIETKDHLTSKLQKALFLPGIIKEKTTEYNKNMALDFLKCHKVELQDRHEDGQFWIKFDSGSDVTIKDLDDLNYTLILNKEPVEIIQDNKWYKAVDKLLM